MNKAILESAAVGLSLPSQGTYLCLSTTFAEDLGQGTYAHVVELQAESDLDTFSGILITDEKDISTYVTEQVIVSFRGEVMDGVNVLRISKLSIISMVTTLDRTEGIKLYPKELPESKSTVIFSEVTMDDPIYQGIVFVASSQERMSSRSTWIEYEIIDKKNQHAVCRLFNPDPDTKQISDVYVKCDLSFNPKYGFQSTFMEPVHELGTYVDPAVEICKSYLTEVISGIEPNFRDALTKSDFVNHLHKNAADVTLFEAASACHIAQDFQNVSRVVDQSALTEAVLMQFWYVAATQENDFISKDLMAALLLTKYNVTSILRVNAIDITAEKVYLESQLAKSIVETAKLLIETEKRTSPGSKVVIWS